MAHIPYTAENTVRADADRIHRMTRGFSPDYAHSRLGCLHFCGGKGSRGGTQVLRQLRGNVTRLGINACPTRNEDVAIRRDYLLPV